MKRGKERVEILRPGIGMRGKRIVSSVSAKKVCAYDPPVSVPTDRAVPEGTMKKSTESELLATSDAPQSKRSEVAAGKAAHACCGTLANYKIPRLIRQKVRAEGRVPRILVLKSSGPKIVGGLELIELPPPSHGPAEEQQAPHEHIEELAAEAVVTEAPAPRKARFKTPKFEAEAGASTTPVQKPLKVIRRRREQTPKVFETMAKSFPRAMLEGIDLESGENSHRRAD